MNRLPKALFALLLAALCGRADAAILTYTWNDDGTGSTFGGLFRADTELMPLLPDGTRLLTAESITESSFIYTRVVPGFVPLRFGVVGVEQDPLIDPSTGAVLAGGRVLFGPSPLVVVPAGEFQWLGGQAQFDARFGGRMTQQAFGELVTFGRPGPVPLLVSVGHWDVRVTGTPEPAAVPEPGALALAVGGLAALGVWRGRRGRQQLTA